MNPMIDELMNRWEESLERGHPLTPEQLCEKHPELLNELKSQIHALQAVDAQFGDTTLDNANSYSQPGRASKLNQVIQVTSHFQVDRLHATGGLGEVYLAKDPDLHRTVAIKFPRSDRLNREQWLRFEREAQITGQLNHPGIVPVHALKGDESQHPCYVMRFVDGPTLQQKIDQLYATSAADKTASVDFYSSLEIRQLLQNFVALCNIVAYAHEHGIIHRDIKPSNVILGPFGETLLMDWGLAKALAETDYACDSQGANDSAETVVETSLRTRTGQFMGTPAFASPEQQSGQVELVDQLSDVYSLGATLLAMLTGRVPASEWQLNVAVTNRCGGTVPPRLIAICRQALAQNPRQRYPSVMALREDVECYLAGEPISVVPETTWSRLSRIVRKKSGWAAAILVGVSITTLAVGVGSWVLNYKNQQLQQTNQQLEAASASSLAAQQRSTATTQLLTRALQAATPEIAQGQDPTIEQFLNQTAAQLKKDKTILPLVAADTHEVLAISFTSLGDYETAQEHAEAAHKLYCQGNGENSPDAIDVQAIMALILFRRDQHEEAIRVAKDALQRGRAVKDMDAETLAKVLDTCGHVVGGGYSPDPEEALAFHREAYDVARKRLGPENPFVLKISSNLGVALMDAGQLAEGERVLLETLEAHEKILGNQHPDTLVDVFNVIALKRNRGDTQAAADLAQEYRGDFEAVFGPYHHRNIRLALLLTQIAFEQDKITTAELESRRALERALPSLGRTHQYTLEARGMLCETLIAQSKLEEAQELADEQYNMTRTDLGENHPATLESISLLLDLAAARKDLKAMERYVEQLQNSPLAEAARETLENARKQ